MAKVRKHAGEACFVDDRRDLVRLARSIVGCPSIAEDVVQDSWLRWQGRSYPDQDAQLIFRRIVANLARDWRRKDRRERIGLLTLSQIERTAPDTEHVVIARADLAAAVIALGELPERTLAAFRMHRLQNMTYQEIGERLNISTQRAFQLVQRALIHVAVRLQT
ncbi:MAG: sigma-70 family RNA polymerase sigma factor [Pseudomonadota bacterium]